MTTQLGMDPGMLTEEVEILEKKLVPDGQAGRSTQYAPVHAAYEWVRIRPLSARERSFADQAGAPAQFEVTMRYRSDLLSDFRIRWIRRDIQFEITTDPLNLDEREEFVVFQVARARD